MRVVLLTAGLALIAQPAFGQSVTRIVPTKAVAGAAVEVRGSGLSNATVTIGGKRARVLRSRATSLRVVVPKTPAGRRRVVVRRGRRSDSVRMRVLRPFRGDVTARADTARAATQTIGAAGGEISATGRDRTQYRLRIPAGALASDQQITMTPVRSFGGLPFTGKARGVTLAPDGLGFATPATLTITTRGAAPAKSVAFSDGETFEVGELTRSGRTLTIPIAHFSSNGGAGVTPADFANAIGPALANPNPWQTEEADSVLALIGAFEDLFAPFCATQPLCGQAVAKGLASMETRIDQRCNNALSAGRPAVLADVRAIADLEARRRGFETQGTTDFSEQCRNDVLTRILTQAKTSVGCPTGGDPLGQFGLTADLAPADGGSGDLDGDGEITNLEFLFFLGGPLNQAAHPRANEAATCVRDRLFALQNDGKALCDTDRGRANSILNRAFAYARSLFPLEVQGFIDALDFCNIALQIVPTSIPLFPNAFTQFAHIATDVIDAANNSDVTWSAALGSIDPAGFYTAPSSNGTDTVTATSVVNPSRQVSATVDVNNCIEILDGTGSLQGFPAGADFRVVSLTVRYGSGTIMLTHDCDGDEEARVNDEIIVEVTPPGGPTTTFSHDFSNGCGTIESAGPFNLTSHFRPGDNQVTVRFRNTCGGDASAIGTNFVLL